MKTPDECTNMDDIREAIDSLDNQIVKSIASRANYVHAAAKFKKNEAAVKDETRVQKVISSKKDLARKYGASPELIGNIYTMMIDFFVNEEMTEWKNNK